MEQTLAELLRAAGPATANPNLLRQGRNMRPANPEVPKLIDETRKFIVGETPGEMLFNVGVGAPGKMLKLAGMGAAALAGSDDAEAGVMSKILREGGKRMSRAESEAAGLWDSIGKGNKLSIPRSEMKFETAPDPRYGTGSGQISLPERKIIQPSDLQGGHLMPFPGDRTSGGKLLKSVNGNELRNYHTGAPEPVRLEAGADYMLTHKDLDELWATNKQSRFDNMIGTARDKLKTDKLFGDYSTMGATSGDFSKMMTDTIWGQMHGANIPKVWKKEFDAVTKNKFPEWTSIDDPAMRELMADNGAARKAFVESTQQKKFQKWMPDVPSSRHSITEPMLEDWPDQTSGFSIGEVDMSKQLRESTRPHQSYKWSVPGKAGSPIMQLEKPIPRDVMYPAQYDARRAAGGSAAGDRRSFELMPDTVLQPTDQKWVDQVSAYIEKMKKEGGYVDPKLLAIVAGGAGTAEIAQQLREYQPEPQP